MHIMESIDISVICISNYVFFASPVRVAICLCYTDLYVNAVCIRGKMSSHPTDCRKFRICDHDKWFIFDCAPSTAWNQAKLTCVWPIDANCNSTTEDDPCSSNPCGDGGSCLSSGSGHTCICRNGYSGPNCQYGINTFCGSTPADNPCVGGTCYNAVNRYRCVCEDGFAGNPCRDCNELWQCPFRDLPYLLPDPADNSKYMMCINGNKQRLFCDAGQIFRPFQLQCS